MQSGHEIKLEYWFSFYLSFDDSIKLINQPKHRLPKELQELEKSLSIRQTE